MCKTAWALLPTLRIPRNREEGTWLAQRVQYAPLNFGFVSSSPMLGAGGSILLKKPNQNKNLKTEKEFP